MFAFMSRKIIDTANRERKRKTRAVGLEIVCGLHKLYSDCSIMFTDTEEEILMHIKKTATPRKLILLYLKISNHSMKL